MTPPYKPMVDAVVAHLLDVHHPVPQEIEVFHGGDDRDLPGPCPIAGTHWTSDPHCPGHDRTVQVCAECGYEHDGDYPTFRRWPCPTVQALVALVDEGPTP